MGGNFSTIRGVKRQHEEEKAEASPEQQNDGESELHTPKRKRFQSTSKYIVKTLFEEGANSDVTIKALGKDWHLHRLYLCQCKYFDSMFSGSWLESEQSSINIDIRDGNISCEALKIAFKSLYTDNVFVKPVQAVGVLAAATFLQLDPLIEHCRNVMKGCINFKTVCPFLSACDQYGLLDVRDNCLTWLYHCLMAPGNSPTLSDMSEELLISLLDNRELWLLQVEVDVYTLIKKWIFLQCNSSWTGTDEALYKDCKDFFKRQSEENQCCFLETDEGCRYIPLFEKVRWMYVVDHLSAVQLIKDDQILPVGWLDPFFKHCWMHHLRTEQGEDTGPNFLSDEDFYKNAMRCGRIMLREQEYHWRWLGYQYGLDLLFTVRNRTVSVKRNVGTLHKFEGSLSQQKDRRVMLQLKVSQIKKKDMTSNLQVKSTNILNFLLHNDDVDFVLMTLDSNTKFPLQVTMYLLYVTPSLPSPFLAIPPPPISVIPSQTKDPDFTPNSQKQESDINVTETKDKTSSERGEGEPCADVQDGSQRRGDSRLSPRSLVGVIASLEGRRLSGSGSSLHEMDVTVQPGARQSGAPAALPSPSAPLSSTSSASSVSSQATSASLPSRVYSSGAWSANGNSSADATNAVHVPVSFAHPPTSSPSNAANSSVSLQSEETAHSTHQRMSCSGHSRHGRRLASRRRAPSPEARNEN